jgi:hypothetical protein
MSSSDVSTVTNHFSIAAEGFTTTTSGLVSSAAGTIGLSSVSGLTNGNIFVGIIEPGGSKEQTFTGVVDTGGSQITGVKWTRGLNVDHSAGVTVVDYVTGTGHNMMTKGILVHADQDGTLKAGAVDNAAVLASDVVTTAKILNSNVTTVKIADNNITAAKLATDAITLASINSSTSQSGISSSFVILTGLSTTVTIPSGGRAVRIEGFVPLISSSAICTISLGIYESATVTGSPIQTSTLLFAVAGATGTTCHIIHEYTPAAGSKSYCLAVKVDTGSGSTSLSSTQLASLTVKVI